MADEQFLLGKYKVDQAQHTLNEDLRKMFLNLSDTELQVFHGLLSHEENKDKSIEEIMIIFKNDFL